MTSGLLIIDKPTGPTSHDLVAIVRRGTSIKKVGHAGTLDPLASGVMVMAIGHATRLLEYFTAGEKSYRATITLGIETDTYDTEGSTLAESVVPDLAQDRLSDVLRKFQGEITQIPPRYSAIKIKGRAAYDLARKGELIEMQPRQVAIYAIDLIAYEPPKVTVDIRCSPGTYIRSLAHDIGALLGTGAALSALTRTASGSFHLSDAISLDTLRASFGDGTWRNYLLPADRFLSGWESVSLTEQEASAVFNGTAISRPSPHGLAKAYDPAGTFIAVFSADPEKALWQPTKVFK